MSSLLIAIALSTGILICFRVFERYNINILQAILWNYLIASSFGFMISAEKSSLAGILAADWMPYAAIIGFFFIVVFNLFAHSSQKIGIGVTAVASKMSVVIPILMGVIIYDEHLGIIKLSGIVLAILAFWFTLGGNINILSKVRSNYWYLPLLLFFGNGINDSLMKHVETSYLNGSSMLMISSVFTVSLILGILYILIFRPGTIKHWKLKNFTAGVILGLLNLGSTFFFFESIAVFPNTVFFPVFNVSMVSLSAISGYFFFSEVIGRKRLFGIIFALLSIILIALSK